MTCTIQSLSGAGKNRQIPAGFRPCPDSSAEQGLHVPPLRHVLSFVSRFWLCFATWAVCVHAANPPLESLFRGVENRYNKAQSMEVVFHESYTAPQRPRTTESGTLR